MTQQAETIRRWTSCTHANMHTRADCPSPVPAYADLPIHETAVCPMCGWGGVTMRGEACDCHRCNYRWRWPLTIDLGMD